MKSGREALMQITHQHAELCSGIGDFHRILILYALAEKEQNVGELVVRIGLSQPAVSRHLKILRDCGAVVSNRKGKAVYYTPADLRIVEALDLLRAILTDQIRRQGLTVSSARHRPFF